MRSPLYAAARYGSCRRRRARLPDRGRVLELTLPAAAPSWAALFGEGCFGQRPLIAAKELRDAAVARGIGLPPFPRRDVLEPLDEVGGLSPVGFLQTNFTPETTWLTPDPAFMVWREERNFASWDEHAWRSSDHPGFRHVSERYSPWQLLYLPQAIDDWNARVPLGRLERRPLEMAKLIRAHRGSA